MYLEFGRLPTEVHIHDEGLLVSDDRAAGAGLEMERGRSEVEPINFLPRITIPTLMLNAKYDHIFPSETAQKPFYRPLGSPPDRKRYVVYEGRHVLPRTQLIRESLDWLDKYLGPVK